jgi:hypothetical protein
MLARPLVRDSLPDAGKCRESIAPDLSALPEAAIRRDRKRQGWNMNTTSISDAAFRFLLAIGECHRRLSHHAIRLRELGDVRTVQHMAYMPELADAFRLDQFVDAELVTGDAISWWLEITVTGQNIAVEADVRRIHSEGQDVIVTIGEYIFSTDAACAVELPCIAERLCSANPL